MPLTEAEKVKILEEEKFRKETKKKLKGNAFNKGCLTILLLLFGIPFVMSIVISLLSPDSFKTSSKSNPVKQQVSQVLEGVYIEDYPYKVLVDSATGKYQAQFYTKFLPRNDAVVIGAMVHLINGIYGEHTVTDLSPELVDYEGISVFRFSALNSFYYFMPIKEDTGEIHTLVFWEE